MKGLKLYEVIETVREPQSTPKPNSFIMNINYAMNGYGQGKVVPVKPQLKNKLIQIPNKGVVVGTLLEMYINYMCVFIIFECIFSFVIDMKFHVIV